MILSSAAFVVLMNLAEEAVVLDTKAEDLENRRVAAGTISTCIARRNVVIGIEVSPKLKELTRHRQWLRIMKIN